MFRGVLKHLIPLAVVITFMAGLAYLLVQQNLRITANDPQIQMAEDAATALAGGQLVDNLVPASKIDIAQSLSPYLVVFDDTGQPIASSGLLHGQAPAIPAGIFDYTRNNGEDRLTWQPEPGIRTAAIVVHYGGPHAGFVLAGRSLREVEKRIDNFASLIAIVWLLAIVATAIIVFLCELIFTTRDHPA